MASPNLPPPSSPGLEVAHDYYASPDARAEDLTYQQISRLREELDTNLFLFARMICGFRDLTPSYHGPICKFLDLWGRTDLPGGSPNFGWKRLMLQISRDTFKTSIGTVANALQKVARSPDGMATVGVFNAKESRTFAWVRTIREIVESNLLFQTIYEDRVPPGISKPDREKGKAIPQRWRWSDHALDLVRDRPLAEASISGHGATGSAAGWHFDYVIKDDLIEVKHAQSQVEMDRVWEWCETARYLEKPAEKGNELWIYHRKILDTDPHTGEEYSTFPERFKTEELQRERDSRPFYFKAQRQNEPAAGKEQSFDPDWLRFGSVAMVDGQYCFIIDKDHYDPYLSTVELETGDFAPRQIPLPWCNTMLLWDPAPSEESDRNRDKNARNGIVICSKDPWGRLFVLHAAGLQLNPEEMMRHVVHLCMRWEVNKAAVEEVNFSKVYKYFATYLLRREFPDYHIGFIPQKAERQNKHARILGTLPDFRNGFVYLNEPTTKQLVLEYKEYPYGTTMDILDALAQHRKILFKPLLPEEQFDNLHRVESQRGGLGRGQLDRVNWGH
jgi:hypothetical protein